MDKTLREQAAAKFTEAHAFWQEHKDDSGDLPAEHVPAFDALMVEAKDLDEKYAKSAKTGDHVATLQDRIAFYHQAATGVPLPFGKGVSEQPNGKTLGQQFVESQEYKDLKESGALASDRASFKSAPYVERKAASDIIAGLDPGRGSALILPQYLPGVQPLAQRPLTVRGLFPQETTDSDLLSYARQNAFDSGAAFVAEATSVSTGAKPQSSIGWERIEEPVEAVATWMVATRRQLSDAGQTRGLIDNQGRLMLELAVDDALLNGNGASPNLQGILGVSGVQTLDAGGENISNIDALRRAKRLVKTDGARIAASAVVINPEDGEAIDTLKDDFGRYLAGDPFGASPEDSPIWRMRRVESEAIALGTALVGAFNVGATIFQREPITVLIADQHADFFVRNLIVVLFEERLGFAIYYPASFCVVTFSTWPSGT